MAGANYAYPLAIAADGKTLASTSYDGRVRLWRFQESQLQEVLRGRSWSTTPSNLNAEGQTLSTRDTDSIYRTCQAENGQLLRSLPGPSQRCHGDVVRYLGEMADLWRTRRDY